jgi:aromatic ring-opening dioxygenase LigB subunit
MCHAPIVIPAIAGDRGGDCAASTAAMREAARIVVDSRPERIVVLSPHTPRSRAHPDRWGLVRGDRLQGSFVRFRAPGLTIDLPNADQALQDVLADVPLVDVPGHMLVQDHGALVPLWFLVEAGWSGPTAVLGVPWENRDADVIGRRLGQASGWAVVASGDMSHRLKPGAPAGFDPRAQAFDDGFVTALRDNQPVRAVSPDPALRERAAEDVIDTTSVLVGARQVLDAPPPVRILSYEGPFGVGYCIAEFHAGS